MTRLSVAAGSLWAIVLVAPLLWVINVGVRVWLPVFFLIFAGVRAKRAPSTFLYFGPLLADSLLFASVKLADDRPANHCSGPRKPFSASDCNLQCVGVPDGPARLPPTAWPVFFLLFTGRDFPGD
jgi:hypothetical protein